MHENLSFYILTPKMKICDKMRIQLRSRKKGQKLAKISRNNFHRQNKTEIKKMFFPHIFFWSEKNSHWSFSIRIQITSNQKSNNFKELYLLFSQKLGLKIHFTDAKIHFADAKSILPMQRFILLTQRYVLLMQRFNFQTKRFILLTQRFILPTQSFFYILYWISYRDI